MYKSTISRQARRSAVKAIKLASLRDKNTKIYGGICQYVDESNIPKQKDRIDIRRAIRETLAKQAFITSAVMPDRIIVMDDVRTAMRMKFLRIYAEQGVAYTPFEWLTTVDTHFAKWKSEVDEIAKSYGLFPAVNPSVSEQETWTKHYMYNLTPQQAWDATPWR